MLQVVLSECICQNWCMQEVVEETEQNWRLKQAMSGLLTEEQYTHKLQCEWNWHNN